LEEQKEELQRAERALESARARFVDLLEYTNALYNQAPVGYLTLTAEGMIVEANLSALSLLKCRREQLLHQLISRFIVEADRESYHSFHIQLLASKHAQRCEVRMRRADGTSLVVLLDAIVTGTVLGEVSSEEAAKLGPYVRLTLSDISARVQAEDEERKTRLELEATLADLRQTQEQLVRQERMAVVGQLAAGIAHDFNNIMASITLYSQLIMRAPDLPATLHKRMEGILTQSKRAADLVQQMLDFGRRTAMTRQSTALCEFLRQFVEMLQNTLPDTIQVVYDCSTLYSGIDDVVDIDAGRIQQALLNLALNSRDAMPNGGRLWIKVSRLVLPEHTHTGDAPAGNSTNVASGTLSPGDWLRLDFGDDGDGIEPDHLPHLFEPFFTTKEIGLGSGLGLSQVWGLVKQHNGEIDVVSDVGKGTVFSIYLPASSAAPIAPAPSDPTVIPHGHGELVLVVEDSDFLRTAILSTLSQLGYQTLAASNGQEAFDLIIKEGEKVELILSDLSMPVMGGKELIRAVRSQGWKQPVITLTGQPLSEAEIVHLQSYGHISRLQKPVVMERLALALRQALNDAGE
jgi:PAS domain S-box-containing protein